jgi:hypothetical protein
MPRTLETENGAGHVTSTQAHDGAIVGGRSARRRTSLVSPRPTGYVHRGQCSSGPA